MYSFPIIEKWKTDQQQNNKKEQEEMEKEREQVGIRKRRKERRKERKWRKYTKKNDQKKKIDIYEEKRKGTAKWLQQDQQKRLLGDC